MDESNHYERVKSNFKIATLQTNFHNLQHLAELHITGHEYSYERIRICCKEHTFPKSLKTLHIKSLISLNYERHKPFIEFLGELTNYCRQLRSLELRVNLERVSIDIVRLLRRTTELNSLVVPIGAFSPSLFDEVGILLSCAPFMQKLEFFMAQKCFTSSDFDTKYAPEKLQRSDLF